MSEFVITIARGFGSGGKTIGQMLAKKLDIDYFDNDLLRLASEESGINIALFGKVCNTAVSRVCTFINNNSFCPISFNGVGVVANDNAL